MVRDLDPDGDARAWAVLGTEGWSDYDSAMAYGDFDVAINGGNPVPTDQARYLSGFGTHAQQTISTAETRYLHGDLIRSANLTTDDSGSAAASVAYTAFGEPIGDASLLETRYQYAGGWGYESDLLVLEGAPGTTPITLQHVGHRWYDPALGRFIQRDPIGLAGGLNVYAYVGSSPLGRIDPYGLRLEYDIVVTPGYIVIHTYEIPEWWQLWKDPRYVGRRRIPLNGFSAGNTGNATADDANACVLRHTVALGKLIGEAAKELDEELRKQLEEWLAHGGAGVLEGALKWWVVE